MVAWLVRSSTTVMLAVLMLFLFGWWSYLSLPRESSPDIKIPVILISTPYIGVSPEDVEGLVTIPLERELAGLQDVKTMKSTSAEGVSIVSIEFEPEVVIEDALQKVRDRVNRARSKLPEDVEEPSVQEIAFSDIPIVILTIAGPVDEQKLKDIGEDLQDELARIPGVLDARLSGGMTRQIRVQVDPLRLSHYGLALHDVTGAIGEENVNIPGGNVDASSGNILLRVPGELTSAEQIENVAIKRVGDRPVFIRDIGRVVEGFEERKTYARMNGQPAVSIGVTKRPGANIIDLVDAVKAEVAKQATSWPEKVEYRVLSDQSKEIRSMVSDLQNNIITALLLVLGVLLVSMGPRASTFVAFSIPLSMLISFMILQLLGYTLNMIVLFSLILALGMLVDNSIVVIENIYRHMEEGKDAVAASIDGTNEVAIAVAASTLTTVAAFFPMVFWGGIMGEFMGFLPKTVIIVLSASLLVGVWILPVFTAISLKRDPSQAPIPEEEALHPKSYFMRAYKAVLQFSIRFRYLSAAIGVASLIGTTVIFGMFNHGVEFFPDTEPDRATVGIRLADGADLEATDRVVRQVEAALMHTENVKVFVAETGVSGGGDPFAQSAAPNSAKISLDFLPHPVNAKDGEKERVESTFVTIDRLREQVKQIPGAEISVEKENMGPPVGKPISVEVSGDDYHAVGAYALKLRRELAAIEGTTELKDNYRVGRPELRLRIDRGAAKRVGVSSSLVGNTVRTAVAGAKASALRDGEDEYDIVVELDPAARQDLQQVLSLRVPGRIDTSPNTFPVPISTVADYELAGGSGAIYHVDQDLVITITGDVLDGYNANDVVEQVKAHLAKAERPEGIYTGVAGADQEQAEAAAFLGWAFAVAVALIMLVLVAQFDSILIPGIIMCSVVLSTMGVMWGLLITGTPFGIIMTGIGVISLAGVVVNNAIVLLDYVAQLRARGLSAEDALLRAGLVRFRPVMLTAITTVLGLIPMALGISFDFMTFTLLVGGSSAQFWGPMAIAVIFGLAFATVMTLVMVPTLYGIYDDWNGLVGWARGGFKREAAAPSVDAMPTLAKVLLAGLLLGSGTAAQAVTLDEAIAAAEQHDVQLQILREQTFRAENQTLRAWSTLSPTVHASGTYIINQYESKLDFSEMIPPELAEFAGEGEPVVVQMKRFGTANLSVNQTLFSATALPLLKGAYANADAAALDEQHSAQRIRAGVARAYYGLYAARKAEELSALALKNASSQLDLAQRQMAAGTVPERAVLQARLALSRAERDVLAATERRIAAEESFFRMTGLPKGSDLSPPALPTPPPDVDAALELARERRADLQAAARRQEIATYQQRVTQGSWAPRLTAGFQYNYSQNKGFNPTYGAWMATVNASWTLWDGGARIADARDAAAGARIADLAARQTLQSAEEEVRVAFAAYERAGSALSAVTREVELATESVRLAELALGAGAGTWLEVEQAELGRAAAELGALQERMQRDLAALDLLVACGGW